MPPNRANLPEPVSASAMLGPLPCSNRKNREKPSFRTAEQGFQSHEHLPTRDKVGAFRHFHASTKGLPCYAPEQGLISAEQGFIPHPTGDFDRKTGDFLTKAQFGSPWRDEGKVRSWPEHRL